MYVLISQNNAFCDELFFCSSLICNGMIFLAEKIMIVKSTVLVGWFFYFKNFHRSLLLKNLTLLYLFIVEIVEVSTSMVC